MIEVDHMVDALVIEDGGREGMARLLNIDPNLMGTVKTHRVESHPGRFFPPELAPVLIARIDNFFPPAQPIPQSQDMPISAELKCIQHGKRRQATIPVGKY
jgi:hypothetical protein